MKDIYKIHISFDGYLPSGEVTPITYTISEGDKIDDHLIAEILTYRNIKLRVQHNNNLGAMRASGKYKEDDLKVLEVPDDFKYKVDKEYDNVEQVVNDAVDIKYKLFGKGRNVCIEIAEGRWGVSCCEECGWSYQWETLKTIQE